VQAELSAKQLRAAIAGFMSEDFNRAHFKYTTKKTTVLLRELHASILPSCCRRRARDEGTKTHKDTDNFLVNTT
jgi:hypothetical protein